MADTDVTIRIDASGNASIVMQETAQHADNLSKVVTTGLGVAFGDILTEAANFATEALRQLGEVFVDAFNEAQQDELMSVRLAQQVRNVGAETGITNDFLSQMVDKYRDLAGGSDDVVKATESILLRFTNITKDIYPQALQLSADLAATMGTDMTSAAQMLGRALEDPASGMMLLRRAGVVLDADQQNLIKSMEKAGDTTGAQALLMKDLAGIVGGTAAAAANTMSGRWAIMQAHLEDVAKGIMGKLLPPLEQLFDQYIKPNIPVIEAFGEKLGEWALTIFPQVVKAISDAIVFVQTYWPGIQAAIQPVVDAVGGILKALGELVGAIFGDMFKTADEKTTGMSNGFALVMQAIFNTATQSLNLVRDIFTTVTRLIKGDWQGVWSDISDTVVNAWGEIFGKSSASTATIQNLMGTVGKALKGDWQGVWDDISAHLELTWILMRGKMARALEDMQNGFINFWNTMSPLVKQLLTIFVPGLGTAVYSVMSADVSKLNSYIQQATTMQAWNAAGQSTDTLKAMLNALPGRAGGGPVNANQPYIVGEHGPELFVPRNAGMVQPSVTNNWNYSPHYQSTPANDPVASFAIMRAMVSQ